MKSTNILLNSLLALTLTGIGNAYAAEETQAQMTDAQQAALHAKNQAENQKDMAEQSMTSTGQDASNGTMMRDGSGASSHRGGHGGMGMMRQGGGHGAMMRDGFEGGSHRGGHGGMGMMRQGGGHGAMMRDGSGAGSHRDGQGGMGMMQQGGGQGGMGMGR